MEEKTPLERACQEILGEEDSEHYKILSNLLLLNYRYIKKNDTRLSAKITAILFDNSDIDKVHFICEHIENAELSSRFSRNELKYSKKLLDIDPELRSTQKIISNLKTTIVDRKFLDIVIGIASNERNKWIARTKMRTIAD